PPCPPGFDSPIGIGMSGGGYRAAGYNLGLLSYLHRLDLLKQVTMLSTVSGGTFTGVKYVLSVTDNVPFADFFNGYRKELIDNDLVKLALQALGGNSALGTPEKGNLITSI